MGNHQKKRLAAKIHNEEYVTRKIELTVFNRFVELLKEKAAMLMHPFSNHPVYTRHAI